MLLIEYLVNIKEFFDIDLNGFTLNSYLILLTLTGLWILIIFTLYERLIAILAQFCLNKFCLTKNFKIKIKAVNFRFVWLCIHFKDVNIVFNDQCVIRCHDLLVQFSKYSQDHLKKNYFKQIFLIKFNVVSIVLLETNKMNTICKRINTDLNRHALEFFKNSIFEFTKFKLYKQSTLEDYLVNIETNRFVFAFSELNSSTINDLENGSLITNSIINSFLLNIDSIQFQLSNNNSIYKVIEANQLKIQFLHGNLPDYTLKNEQILKPTLIVDLISDDSFQLNIDIWNVLFRTLIQKLDLNDESVSILIRFKLQNFDLMLKNSNDILFKLNSSSLIELVYFKEVNTFIGNIILDSLSLKTLINKEQLIEATKLKINLKINNDSIDLNSKIDKLKLNLINIVPNINLALMVNKKFKSLLSSHKQLNLNGTVNSLVINFINKTTFDSIKLVSTQIELKYYSNCLLIVLSNNYLLNYLNTSKDLKFFCEKICFETISSSSDTKNQILFSPILFGENLALELNQDNFITFNLVFITVIQIRFQFYYDQDFNYAKQIEITIGDIFGSIDLEHLINLIEFLNEITYLYLKEFDIKSEILNSFLHDQSSYLSIRLLTSLIHLNLLELHVPLNQSEISSLAINLILSPINYGKCNFHSGYFYLLPVLNLKLLCSLNETANDELHLSECAHLEIKYTNSEHQILIDKLKIEKLQRFDEDNKHFWFLNNQEITHKTCSCSGNSEFFSLSNSKLYNLTDFIYKPCINWINNNDLLIYGFGQSLIIRDEMCFYSCKKFIKNQTESKPANYRVLSHFETKEKDLSKKFEPYEIGIYTENDLNKFLNDNINLNDIKTQSFEILTSNFNSANMSPPYFSNEFSIYIRYLPAINIKFKPKSDIVDYEITDKLLKELNLFDTKLLKDSDSFLNINRSNHSLNRIESNLSITNLSLNKSHLNQSLYSLDSEISIQNKLCDILSNEQVAVSKTNQNLNLPNYIYNLKQIYSGYKLIKQDENSQKINIQHLRLESIIKSNDSVVQSTSGHLNILLTPLSFACLSLLIQKSKNHITCTQNHLFGTNKFEINKFNLKLMIIETNETISFEINHILFDLNSIALNEFIIDKKHAQSSANSTDLSEWLTKFHEPLNNFINSITKDYKQMITISNLIILNIENSILIPGLDLTMSNSVKENLIQLKLVIKELSLIDLIPIGALFNLIITCNRFPTLFQNQSFVILKLIIQNMNFKAGLNNGNYLVFNSEQFEINYSNNFFKVKRFYTVFKFKFKIDFILLKDHFSLINTEFLIDQNHLDTNIQCELAANSLLNESNKYLINITLPLPIEANLKLENDNLSLQLPGLLAYCSHTNKELNNIYQLIELSSVCLLFDLQQLNLDLKCTKFRLMKSEHNQSISLFELLSHFLALNPNSNVLNNNLRFQSNETVICYFPDNFQSKQWLLIKLQSSEFECNLKVDSELFQLKLNDVLIATNQQHDSKKKETLTKRLNKHFLSNNKNNETNNKLSIKTNLCLLITSNTWQALNKFEFKKWLDFVCLDKIDSFEYKIQLVAMCSNSQLSLRIQNSSHWSLDTTNKFYLNSKLFESIHSDLFAKFKTDFKYKQLETSTNQNHLYDLNGKQLTADKDLNYLNKNQFVSLIHSVLFKKYENMFLLIGLIKRNNTTNAIQLKTKTK